MEPIVLSVSDENIFYELSSKKQNGTDRSDNRHIIYPTHFKYIFEDPEETIPSSAEPISDINEDDSVENVIVLNFNESHKLLKVELLSENAELLSFKLNKNLNSLTKLEDSQNEDSNQVLDIELDVVSNFRNIDSLTDDLPLDKLIKLYNVQNDQIQKITDSI
ncbi:similar to Saccharomyces cerevisiae YDR022C CIS1 Autophagy-specific protein required for autophagosome formation [Maudiozyma barnettii]|uniref:Similar to Saccharomyces cerevisiae YDR022C CIS1 Autophagy-specific protein required for autophagosome formation n=1 Tax=Maudiozyma barnettii TaxID=61262 RepID=A0A8H2VD91_9SACH|nr:Atg31p [Kazachstania barnettii]CAB4253138.1 similar to Saccharomyces cerevisiae YDR022C CIS1 Autophagy-specific protein required for autophagosome formation [Kazachstania barnettii]CAD1780326.1 similar to Saccharomyces cerevisiae YDR022C CIS1 Autophagy-specific protein required for autophagosome formation [Kazachstania barnettii]